VNGFEEEETTISQGKEENQKEETGKTIEVHHFSILFLLS
jgi:hypothetical protein